MPTIKTHISCNIEELLRNFKNKKINFLEDDNGRRLSDAQAILELDKLQRLGYKLIPRDDCEGFDPYGGGCLGHPIENDK